MYLSRLFLMPSNRDVQRDLSDPHQMHRTVMRAFPKLEAAGEAKNARASFGVLYRVDVDRTRGRALLYVQSLARPDFGYLAPGYLMDMAGELLNPATRELDEAFKALREGQRLAFVLRANATKKVKSKSGEDGKRVHGKRVPLAGDDGRLSWLTRKAEQGGFALLPVDEGNDVLDVRISEEPKQRDADARRGKAGLTLEPVLYEGRLAIVDATRFRQTLREGIGPSKAYGCGLLSIAPA